jgi:putative inorganic carbon (HCO3(-)) transporter
MKAGPGTLLRDSVFTICAGSAIGIVVSVGLYATKTAYVAVLPVALAMVLPVFVIKNARMYWFAVFLLSLQLEIVKNLNDGRAVVQELKINYTIWAFTFQITLTDLVLLVLLAFLLNDILFRRKALRVPSIFWLAVAYVGIALLSTIGATSPYLGFVQISQEIKYLIAFLFAVNCLDTKGAVRVLVLVGVVILVTQAGMTLLRYYTGYITPLIPSGSVDLSEMTKYLEVDRTAGGSAVRGYGTLNSPGSTTRLCMMVIPFALLLCVRNVMFRMPLVFAVLTCFGLVGLVFTFTRVYFIVAAFQCGLAFLLMIRDRMLKRREIVLIVMAGLAGIAAISPKIYEQFTVRSDSATVRFSQYEAAFRMILDHPVLGVGLNNSTGDKPKYVNITYNQHDSNTQFYLEPTHNMYLSLASEIGIIGAILFFGFFTRIAVLAWRQSRDSPDPEIRWIATALFMTFVSVAVSGLMDPFQEHATLYLLWIYAGITLNLPRMVERPEARSAAARRQVAAPRRRHGPAALNPSP